MPSERQIISLVDFSGGQQSDLLGLAQPPAWDILKNLWLDHAQLTTRPFASQFNTAGNSNIYFTKTHDDKIAYTDGNYLYVDFQRKDVLNGGLALKSDTSQIRTLFANGGNQIQYWNGTTHATITAVTSVYALATIHGYTKERVIYASLADKRTLNYSTYDITDFGTQITDADNINDAWTDGGSIYNFPYEIIDLAEFKNVIFVFTTGAIYLLRPNVGMLDAEVAGDVFHFEIEKFMDVKLHDIPVAKAQNTVYFVTHAGIGAIGLTEFNNFSSLSILPMGGMRKTILKALNPSQAMISFDTERNLFYFKVNNTATYTNVFGADNIWFEWDIPINSFAAGLSTLFTNSVESFISLDGDSGLYRLVEDVAGVSPTPGGIDLQLYSGLVTGDNPVSRKHARSIAIDLKTGADKIDYALDVDNKAVNTKLLNKIQASTVENNRLVWRTGQRGDRFKVVAELTAYDKTIINGLYVEYLEKPPRKSLNSN